MREDSDEAATLQPAGGAPVIRLIFCLRRLPALTRDEFQSYWRELHAPLVARHATVLGIARYVQHHTLDEAAWRPVLGPRATGDAFDGVAELGWASEADLRGDPGDAARQAAGRALLEDERRFIDLSRSPIFVARGDVIVG